MNDTRPTVDPATRGETLITGGAGFIGTNLAAYLLAQGAAVHVFDNLARPGVAENLRWLSQRFPRALRVTIADLGNAAAVGQAVAGAAHVFHCAAQVAVTASMADPLADFETNARGTLHLLEAIRRQPRPPTLLFTSTNKVYGSLGDIPLRETRRRYVVAGEPEALRGVGESRPLSFQTPYGCSKGAADQYVLDYARTYKLPACVFRMSCIYGPHQWGTEDQGWVAHFVLRALAGQPITIYGDGKQVRDILHVDDLVAAFLLAEQHIETLRGQPFNLGGGAANAWSLLELAAYLEEIGGRPVTLEMDDWRPGDQRYYISDTRRFSHETGWRPQIDGRTGIAALHRWLAARRFGVTIGSGVPPAAPADHSVPLAANDQ